MEQTPSQLSHEGNQRLLLIRIKLEIENEVEELNRRTVAIWS
jgi:hypothetical protein